MEFSERLNSYLRELGVTARELSEECGISQVTISRYRSGQRTPSSDGSDTLRDLAQGIEALSRKKGSRHISASEVLESFEYDLSAQNITFRPDNFNTIIETFALNTSKMSNSMGYDPSYISRIRSGKRRPPHPEEFIRKFTEYIYPMLEKTIPRTEFYKLIASKVPENDSLTVLGELLRLYLLEDNRNEKAVSSFLRHMDEFSFDKYAEEIRYENLKFTTAPSAFPGSKIYSGTEGQKLAELDFFRLAAISESTGPVYFFTDMDVKELTSDKDFTSRWLFGFTVLLKKGIRFKYIHDLNRPMNELIGGLEALTPLYMTGQIEAYYLPEKIPDVFRHIYHVGENVALKGMGITGSCEENSYHVTTSKSDVSMVRRQFETLLTHALHLMDIYNEDKTDDFFVFLKNSDKEQFNIRRINPALPLYTMPEELFEEILSRNNIAENLKKNVIEYHRKLKDITEKQLKNRRILDEIPLISEDKIKDQPVSLQIPGSRLTGKLFYTYDEYIRHLDSSEEYARTHKNYTLKKNPEIPFRNMSILIAEGNYVWISKMASPPIQFIIRHPGLREIIEHCYIHSSEN